MTDLLLEAAQKYKSLSNVVYRIILGRKRICYEILLRFPEESFYHLAGLQHLTDITFPSKNKQRIFKEILKGNVSTDTLKKSVFYEDYFIEERLTCLCSIEEMLDTGGQFYSIIPQKISRYSSIRADFLFEYTPLSSSITYAFLIFEGSNSNVNEYRLCSLFQKHSQDLTLGAAKTTLLYMEKITNDDSNNIQQIVLYHNPSFKEAS